MEHGGGGGKGVREVGGGWGGGRLRGAGGENRCEGGKGGGQNMEGIRAENGGGFHDSTTGDYKVVGRCRSPAI